MKLKKMEITGFKSFAEKSAIEFPPGISAVVGPNGCGKSNIVDALRWAMGEQSVKQLRGKAMEDVIFAGTNGRPPLNMAEVSLILSNENGTGPEELRDFTEVMISRRLFRSGESAYLINKHPCRLKDITNIFLGSGMGAKSYSVIQQGNIGAITDAGPEERRFFIEEAAGITRYKHRKNETLRKVNATHQNLLRVKDIILEVERQMKSLDRQAKKAEKYKTHQERAKALDILLGLRYYDDYTQKIKETAALLKALKDTDIQHISKIRELDAAVEDIKLKRWQKNEEISNQKADKFTTQRDIDRLENDMVHLRKDVERLATETRDMKAARKELEEKNETMISEMAQVEAGNTDLKQKIESVKSALEKERQDSQTIRDRLANLNQELDISKANLMDLVAREAKYKNIYENASNNKDSLKRRIKRIDEEEALANMKVSEYQKKETQAEEELESCRQEIEALNEQIETIKASLGEKSKSLGEQVRHVQVLEFERNKVKSKHSALKKMEDNFEWYKDGVKAIMRIEHPESEHGDSLSGVQSSRLSPQSIMGLTADILEPEPSFETAVETVLGESLQYVLVDDQKTGMAAIDYLQSQNAGRSGFIPVSSVRTVFETGNGEPKTGNLGRLLDHVSVRNGFEMVSDALLGHVLVTEDMTDAMETHSALTRQQSSLWKTIVTKHGDMISHQGIMVGGARENSSGILSKKHEIRALEHQLTHMDDTLESDRQKQKVMEADVRAAEIDLQQTLEQKNTATQDETDAERAFYKVAEELKHARRHLEMVRLEQDHLLNEESGIDEEIEKYNTVITQVEDEVRAAQDKVAVTSENIRVVSADMEAYDQRVVDLKLRLTSFNAQLENSNNTLRRLQQFQEDGMVRLEQLSRDIVLKDQKQVSSKEKMTEHEQTLGSMYEALKALEKSLELNEAEFQTIETTLKQNDTSVSDIKTRREETLENIRMLELEQSQRRLRQENIASQVEERYHKSLNQFREDLAHRETPQMSVEDMEAELAQCRKKLSAIGDVNLGAIEEYEALKERFDFLCEQRDDLFKAIDDLHKVIRKINKISQERFLKTFEMVNEKLNEVFPRLFDGGSAKLVLTEPDKPLETGVEFMVHPPGKKLTRLSLLSGGEKALSAIAFIFSMFLIKPASFCIMDEIDAPLDEANVFRFNELLRIIGEKSQIIMITHKKKTMEFADTLFGVTMEQKGISKIVSVNFEGKKEHCH